MRCRKLFTALLPLKLLNTASKQTSFSLAAQIYVVQLSLNSKTAHGASSSSLAAYTYCEWDKELFTMITWQQ
jgi:hypothetical protein